MPWAMLLVEIAERDDVTPSWGGVKKITQKPTIPVELVHGDARNPVEDIHANS